MLWFSLKKNGIKSSEMMIIIIVRRGAKNVITNITMMMMMIGDASWRASRLHSYSHVYTRKCVYNVHKHIYICISFQDVFPTLSYHNAYSSYSFRSFLFRLMWNLRARELHFLYSIISILFLCVRVWWIDSQTSLDDINNCIYARVIIMI